MYFVVFFLQKKEHCVIPYNWVRGINYEVIINNGVNRNIKFLAFWTDDVNAFDTDGLPRNNYVPNARGPNSGWHLCHIRRFNVNCFQFAINSGINSILQKCVKLGARLGVKIESRYQSNATNF